MEQVRTTDTQQGRKLKTRCYYTDYVNHMIRFYLSTPEKLETNGKKGADIQNWIAVQDVWHKLKDADKETIKRVFDLHRHIPEGVRLYCQETGADEHNVWILITKTSAAIAKRRNLV